MSTYELKTALNCYREALTKLEKSLSPQVEEVLEILNTRDAVQAAWTECNHVSTTDQQQLVELDALLKSKAGQITKVMDLAEYRNSFQPPAAAWWWRLETKAPPHLTGPLGLVVDITYVLFNTLDYLLSTFYTKQDAILLLSVITFIEKIR